MRRADAPNRHAGRGTGLAAAASILLVLAACGEVATPPGDDRPPAKPPVTSKPLPPTVLRFGGFSSAREAMRTRVLPAFAQTWNRKQPQALRIRTLFAGGEDLADAIEGAFPADVVMLAPPRDADAARAKGLSPTGSRQLPYGGVVCRSLVVLAVRKGNPLGIRQWSDLTRPGLQILSPDPTLSGCGAWNLCAMFGAALRGHAGVPAGDEKAARDFIGRVRSNVVAGGASAHESFLAFLDGVGDVAITYESELAQAWMFGHDIERVLPTSTVLIESSVVLLDRNVERNGTRAAAEALLDHLWTREVQQLLATCGLRPVDPVVAAGHEVQFPVPLDLWNVDELGGWPRLSEQICPLITADGTRPTPPK